MKSRVGQTFEVRNLWDSTRHSKVYVLLAALVLLFLFPLLWMISYSLRPTGLPPPNKFEMFSPPFAFENYARVNDYISVAQYLSNSLKVVGAAVPLTLLTASWAGLAMALLSRRAQIVLLALSIGLLLVPSPALWVPRFILFTNLGVIDSLVPLIAPALMGTNPFYVLLFYISFVRVPRELYEAARLDGANPLQIWYLVALPLARPAIIAVAVLAFTFYWSNYVDPLLYLRSELNYTLPVAVQLLQQAHRSNFPVLMAASVIMVAPVIILFAFAQRFFLQGQITLARWLR
jgi:multiple sugar transport system permease protein